MAEAAKITFSPLQGLDELPSSDAAEKSQHVYRLKDGRILRGPPVKTWGPYPNSETTVGGRTVNMRGGTLYLFPSSIWVLETAEAKLHGEGESSIEYEQLNEGYAALWLLVSSEPLPRALRSINWQNLPSDLAEYIPEVLQRMPHLLNEVKDLLIAPPNADCKPETEVESTGSLADSCTQAEEAAAEGMAGQTSGESDSRAVAIVHRKDEHYWYRKGGEFQGKIAIENRTAFQIIGLYAKITRFVPIKNRAKLMTVVDPIINSRLDIDAERRHMDDRTLFALSPHEEARAWIIKGQSNGIEMEVNSGYLIPRGTYELTITVYQEHHGEVDSMTFLIGQSRSGAVTFRPKG